MAARDPLHLHMLRTVSRAAREFHLIEPGDRIAVGISGGKDSRALLQLLAEGIHIPTTVYGERSYQLVGVHVDGSAQGIPSHQEAIEEWCQDAGVELIVPTMRVSPDEPLPLNCFRCSYNRRKTLFETANAQGCNKVALGHHADDAAATTLMNVLFQGRLETLVPRKEFFDGQLALIRPLIYITEDEIRTTAKRAGWVFSTESCPYEGKTQRSTAEAFLGQLSPRSRKIVRINLWRSGRAQMGF